MVMVCTCVFTRGEGEIMVMVFTCVFTPQCTERSIPWGGG